MAKPDEDRLATFWADLTDLGLCAGTVMNGFSTRFRHDELYETPLLEVQLLLYCMGRVGLRFRRWEVVVSGIEWEENGLHNKAYLLA